MTNIFAVIYLSFTTNCCGIVPLPDGNQLCEYCVVANVNINHVMPDGIMLKVATQVPYSRFSVTEPGLPAPSSLPIPTRSARTTLPPPPPSTALAAPFQLLPPRFANGGPDEENFSRMFRVDFATETNHIYRLEVSRDLVLWEACQPEIDGTGQSEFFFDASKSGGSYRVVSREGVLPQ
jgi:hypothetical protein